MGMRLFNLYIYHRKRGGGGGGGKGGMGGMCPHTFVIGGGGQWYVCAPPPPPLLTPYFYFPLELYVLYNTDKQLFGIFHIPINYLVDNFNKMTQMDVIK